MGQFDGNDHCLSQLERFPDHLRLDAQVVLPGLGIVEHEAEGFLESLHRGLGGKDGHLSVLHLAEAPHVVEAHDVVGVSVGEERRIHAGDLLSEALDPKIGCRVDDEVTLGSPDQKRSASAVVAGIRGSADSAVAADDWNTLGGSSSEKGDFQGGHRGKS